MMPPTTQAATVSSTTGTMGTTDRNTVMAVTVTRVFAKNFRPILVKAMMKMGTLMI